MLHAALASRTALQPVLDPRNAATQATGDLLHARHVVRRQLGRVRFTSSTAALGEAGQWPPRHALYTVPSDESWMTR